jgi:hypothetical protein
MSVLACWATKDFVMPKAQPAQTYSAHDQHSTESATIGLDPYDTAEKAKIFSIHYRDIGFLPIFVVVTNDGSEPISLSDVKAQLITADRTKIPQASEEDIFRRISRPQASASPYPLPFPTKRVKGGVTEQAREELANSRFGAKAVEPHSTQAGFMFFDVSGLSDPLVGAHFYLTGVRDGNGNDLMYFEVPLEKPSGSQTKP